LKQEFEDFFSKETEPEVKKVFVKEVLKEEETKVKKMMVDEDEYEFS